MIRILLLYFVVIVQIRSVMPALHSLKFHVIASTQINNLPDFVYDIYVDEVLIVHYDSSNRSVEYRYDFIKKATADNPNFWQRQRRTILTQESFAKEAMEQFRIGYNKTKGVHFGQATFGCEWNVENEETYGWERYSYDGEDYASLDMETEKWTIPHPRAFFTNLKWLHDEGLKKYRKRFYAEDCPKLLKNILKYGGEIFTTTELPKVSLLQKTPSSPVTCHATGFYPNTADLFWRKDGEQLHMDVDYGQILPNHDGTFQMTANLKAKLTAEVEGLYECVFQLSGVKDDIVVKLDERNILSNLPIEIREGEKQKNNIIGIAVPLAVLVLVGIIVAIVIFFKCRNRTPGDYAPPPDEMSNSETAKDNGRNGI
nr:major histocompatibility complex class I-related gene protein-like [Nerophis lumbriciformis]